LFCAPPAERQKPEAIGRKPLDLATVPKKGQQPHWIANGNWFRLRATRTVGLANSAKEASSLIGLLMESGFACAERKQLQTWHAGRQCEWNYKGPFVSAASGSLKPETQSQKPQAGCQKPPVRGPKEAGSQKAGARSQKQEARSQEPEVCCQQPQSQRPAPEA
jgi:hypothetical protein